jgi:hypothetical protein
MCIQDRLVALDFVRYQESVHFVSLDGTEENLLHIEEIRKSSNRTVLEFYPTKNQSLDLSNFTGKDIIQLINLTRKNYKLRFWWTGDVKSLPKSIDNVKQRIKLS